jgi:hypothetical protein
LLIHSFIRIKWIKDKIQIDNKKGLKLALIMTPREVEMEGVEKLLQEDKRKELMPDVIFKRPSPSTLDRFKVYMCREWITTWPEGGDLERGGWLALEFE